MTYALAALLRPFVLVALMALVVVPIENQLAKIWPDSSLKRFLFDRTLQKRRPYTFFLVWLIVVGLLVLFCYFVAAT